MAEVRKEIGDLLTRYDRGVRRVVVGQVRKGRNVPVGVCWKTGSP